ncbi:efflux RND transporter periplasmic adaptor subunit [Mangrovitalea sediminis]|uniref:efflux RND transporter periplasmic adaptor subunit n=1 Tax=Mangrovitalea sediminis TaxID=1982043 RepID=UPI000BE556D7|nr:HlyD family secretion protein [Mangrovitalea sediminis]
MWRQGLRVGVTMVTVVIAAVLAYRLWNHYMYGPWTRDARIQADVISVSPDVSGLVTAVDVGDNRLVKKGEVLFVVDQSRYRIALQEALASLDAARADYTQKRAEARRREHLGHHVISDESLQAAKASALVAQQRVRSAEAVVAAARLNLARTEIQAPVDGYVTNLQVHVGDYASAGKAMMAVVDRHSFRVEGYFEETKIQGLRKGDRVSVRLMSGGPRLEGRIEGIARAITNGQDRGLLADVNPSFDWIRLAQRIPVRIRLVRVPAGVTLAAGMTCTVSVDVPKKGVLAAG